jgi:hypothetical protein
MADPKFDEAVSALRDCAFVLVENAAYILDELPNVQANEPLRRQIIEACQRLIATKHDIFSELVDLQDILESGKDSGDTQVVLKRCLAWVREDIDELHKRGEELNLEA